MSFDRYPYLVECLGCGAFVSHEASMTTLIAKRQRPFCSTCNGPLFFIYAVDNVTYTHERGQLMSVSIAHPLV